jgi:hypothetical protein
MAKTQAVRGKSGPDGAMAPVVAATLAGVIYQARLLNRQSKLNIPEDEVIRDVVTLWRTVMDELGGSLS